MKKIAILGSGALIVALCACAADTLTTPAETLLIVAPRHDLGVATSQTMCANAANTTGAFDVGMNGAWRIIPGFPGAGWIGPHLNSHDPLAPVGIGEYTFVTTFSVSGGESLTGQILADNGATVYLNDVAIATVGAVDASTTPSYDAMQLPTPFSATTGFVEGPNSLKVVVYNAWPEGPSGASYCFNVTGASTDPVEPPPNTNPVASVGGPYSGTAGSPVSLSLSGSDADVGDVLSYRWDLGDGTRGSGAAAPPATHTYAEVGVYTIILIVGDGVGGSDRKTSTVTIDAAVTNTNPVASVGGPYSGTEGAPVSFSLSGSDVNADDVLGYSWNLGDGTTGSGSVAPSSHTYADNGVYTITLEVNDGAGGTDTQVTTAIITNVAPALGAITASISLFPLGTSASVTAPLSDPGSADTHSAVIDWGDGSSSTVGSAAGSVSGTHVYTDAGVYALRITATDNNGGISNTATYEYIVVYDPSAGFVTGHGWIASPVGAYDAKPTLAGNATFGFVSRYHKGATAPTGNTEFQFHTAGLEFKSTSYQWLVVAGAKAQFKGDGTMNGVSGYKFLIFATDGQAPGGSGDKFRIKITDPAGNLVYDNQRGAAESDGATTAIDRGNIIIHSK